MKTIVELKDATVQVNNGFDEVKTILDHVNLTIYEHDFITILGEMVLGNQPCSMLLQAHSC